MLVGEVRKHTLTCERQGCRLPLSIAGDAAQPREPRIYHVIAAPTEKDPNAHTLSIPGRAGCSSPLTVLPGRGGFVPIDHPFPPAAAGKGPSPSPAPRKQAPSPHEVAMREIAREACSEPEEYTDPAPDEQRSWPKE